MTSSVPAIHSRAPSEPSTVAARPSVGPAWFGAIQTLSCEHGFEPLEIEGALPIDLVGTLYRNGPGLLESHGRRYGHWFDGDGAVSAVRIADGRAQGAVRVVATEALEHERRRGKRLYTTFGPAPWSLRRPMPIARQKNPANTSVLTWAGRLFATCEAGLPVELNPETLETLGKTDLGGVIPMSFSAHPHRVARTGRIYNFGLTYGAQTLLSAFELLPDGTARRAAEVPLRHTTMLHDFIATERHLVFFVSPLKARLLPLLTGVKSFAECLDWRADLGTEVIVIPLEQPAAVTRFTIDSFFQWHFANAYEDGHEIVVDFVRYPNFDVHDWVNSVFCGQTTGRIDGKLFRARVDVSHKRVREECLWDRPCDFPRVVPSAEGSKAQEVFLATHSSAATATGLPDRIARMDFEGRVVQEASCGEGTFVTEPVFAPKRGTSGDREGYLIAHVYDSKRGATCAAILDAQHVDHGPLAKLWFNHTLPFTFHGAWVER